MNTQDGGGSAFPVPQQEDAPGNVLLYADPGMELRDFFAAHAMVECIRVAEGQTPTGGAPRLSALFEKAGIYAYAAADALIKARSA